MNFYKAKFGKEPPTKKLKPSPSVTEKYYGVDDFTKHIINDFKLNLKRDIYLANQGKPLPPVFYLLESATTDCNTVQPVESLSDAMPFDHADILYSHEVEIETVNDEEENIVSPIKNHPASLYDILAQADAIINSINVDEKKIKEIEECTRSKSSKWYTYLSNRITASKCKRALMKDTTSPTKAMKEILSYNVNYKSAHMKDGIESETQIIKQYCKLIGQFVFIDVISLNL